MDAGSTARKWTLVFISLIGLFGSSVGRAQDFGGFAAPMTGVGAIGGGFSTGVMAAPIVPSYTGVSASQAFANNSMATNINYYSSVANMASQQITSTQQATSAYDNAMISAQAQAAATPIASMGPSLGFANGQVGAAQANSMAIGYGMQLAGINSAAANAYGAISAQWGAATTANYHAYGAGLQAETNAMEVATGAFDYALGRGAYSGAGGAANGWNFNGAANTAFAGGGTIPGGWLGNGSQSGMGGYGFSNLDAGGYNAGGATSGAFGLSNAGVYDASANPWAPQADGAMCIGTDSECTTTGTPAAARFDFGNVNGFNRFLFSYGNFMDISPDGQFGFAQGNTHFVYNGVSNVNGGGLSPYDQGLLSNFANATRGFDIATQSLPGDTLPERTTMYIMQPGQSPYEAPNVCLSGNCGSAYGTPAGVYQFATNTGALSWNVPESVGTHEAAHAIDDQIISQNPMMDYMMTGAYNTATLNWNVRAQYMNGFTPQGAFREPYVLSDPNEFRAESINTFKDTQDRNPAAQTLLRGGVQTPDQMREANPVMYNALSGLFDDSVNNPNR